MGNEIELIDEFVEDDVTLNKLETEINILDEDSELEIELDKADGSELQIEDNDYPSGIELDNTAQTPIEIDDSVDALDAEIQSIFGDNEIEVSSEDIVIDLDYNHLKNHPFINGVELIDNKMFRQLGVIEITNEELDELMK